MSQTISFGVYTPAERPPPQREQIQVWLADGSVEFAVFIDGSFRYRAEEGKRIDMPVTYWAKVPKLSLR